MSDNELKPCPFCRSTKVKIFDHDMWYWIQCEDCTAASDSDLGKSGAIESWNNRPLEDALRAQLDAANERIRQLEAAGDEMSDDLKSIVAYSQRVNDYRYDLTLVKLCKIIDAWRKLRGAK